MYMCISCIIANSNVDSMIAVRLHACMVSKLLTGLRHMEDDVVATVFKLSCSDSVLSTFKALYACGS